MHKAKSIIIDLMLLFIITIPAFIRILNSQYFSMHDDQHIVRLFLLDQGLRQGYLYPRWVDGLGFGFGYPLYNFYPPLVYYVAETFHLMGFSLIWAVKLTSILGFYIGAFGIYLLLRKFTNKLSAFLSAALFTYFFYHATLIYVRGALAEFFSLAILPFVFLTLDNLQEKLNPKRSVLFGVILALIVLIHPLIALPTFIFVGFFFLFYLLKLRFRWKFIKLFILSLGVGLSLSAFFWLPSLLERKYTLVDRILISELASYRLHYIYPQHFIYSPWGYGGSGVGLSDGMTFQLGKIHIGLVLGSIILSIIYITIMSLRVPPKAGRGNPFLRSLHFVRDDNYIRYFYFFIFLLLFSLFMTTEYSSFIWDRVKYLWYLQFPWRFLTFVNIFISITGGYFIYFLFRLLQQSITPDRWRRAMSQSIVAIIIAFTIFTYQKYFRPQTYIVTNDKERTSFEEISWRISRTSYEFVPKDVKTKKSELSTTLLAIEKKDLPKKPYEIISGEGEVSMLKNKFQVKEFSIDAKSPLTFRLNTYNFPGWKAYLKNQQIKINDNNDFKLITVSIPTGNDVLKFVFQDTIVRKIADLLSFATFFLVFLSLFSHLK